MPIAVAMATVTIISCQKVEEEPAVNDDQKIEGPKVEEPTIASLTFTISDNEATKTIIADDEGKKYSDWEVGDKIGYVTSKSDKGSTTVTIGTPTTFTIAPTAGLAVDDVVNVWYPYRKDEDDKASVQMLIPVSQVQSGDTFDFDAMPMVAEPITITSEMLSGDDYAGSIDFANLASLIEFKVFSTDGTYVSEKVAAITFDAGSNNIAGHFNMNVGAVDFDTPATLAISGYTGKSVTTSLASPVTIGTDKASARSVYMVVAPGTYSGNIIVATDAAFYTIPVSDKEFERSGFKSFGIDLAKNVATRRTIKGSFTWDLTQVSYSSSSETSVLWKYGLLTLETTQNSGKTKANNFLPPENEHSRFYTGNNVIFTPLTTTWTIDKIELTATTVGYASAFAGGTWDNAVASSSEVLANVNPTNSSNEFKNNSLSSLVRATAVKVYFDNTLYDINTTDPDHGSLSISGSLTSAKVNTIVTIVATPDDGYALSGLSVKDAGNNDITVSESTFRMPSSAVTVSASFVSTASAYTISTSTNGKGSISTSPANSATAGSTITVTTTPNDGYSLYSLAVTDEDDGNVELTGNTFVMPSKAVTVSAVFYKKASWTASSETIVTCFGTTGDSTGSGTYSGTLTDTQSGSWSTTRSAVTSGKWFVNTSIQNGCVQVGKNGAAENLTITSSSYSTKTIKSVSVECASYSAKHSVAITVGATSFLSSTATTSWTTVGTKTGTGSASGNISITFTAGSNARAMYIKSITVYYDE